MRPVCRVLMCRFLVAGAAAVVVTVAPAAAAPVDAMPVGHGPAGAAEDANGRVAGAGGMAHTLLYEDGTMPGLNDPGVLYGLADPASGWEITDAAATGDAGPIAATACKGGACHAARLDPVPAVPEPSVLALLGAGLALLGWRRRQAWGFTPLAPRCPG